MVRHTASTVIPAIARFYEPVGYCADESVGWLMKRALMSIAQAADRRLEPKGITHAQWAALFMLRTCRASTVAELARETHSDPGAMTRLLDRLEAKGFCRRERSTDDGKTWTHSTMGAGVGISFNHQTVATGKPVVSVPTAEVEKFRGVLEIEAAAITTASEYLGSNINNIS